MAELGSGHLFVVHGRIEDLTHDAAIVPAGHRFTFNRAWTPLVGDEPARPEGWDKRQWGRVFGGRSRIWAVSVGGRPADPYDVILDRIERVLARVGERRDARPSKRGPGARPLVAMPVVGIGFGGYSSERGGVLADLVERITEAAARLDLDVALVTPDPAVYAAAQYARRREPSALPEHLETAARELAKQAERGELALFLGAGVSIPAGLVSWHQLVASLAEKFGVRQYDNPDAPLTAVDQAELIQMKDKKGFQTEVAAITSRAERPSLLHGLLAGLDCREVVTTNYDQLYERAVAATGRKVAKVLPHDTAHGAARWILKLHGDVKRPKTIVLTRRSMVQYDAANRPSGALLQSLLLTRRVLVVGASMTDDNVIRLAHEVDAYRELYQRGRAGTVGTLLDAGGDVARQKLWSGQFDWLDLTGTDQGSGFRVLELFLDRVAFHASRNSSWLLDPRFTDLLQDTKDRDIAAEVRRLYETLPRRAGTKWQPLLRCLREMGVDPKQ